MKVLGGREEGVRGRGEGTFLQKGPLSPPPVFSLELPDVRFDHVHCGAETAHEGELAEAEGKALGFSGGDGGRQGDGGGIGEGVDEHGAGRGEGGLDDGFHVRAFFDAESLHADDFGHAGEIGVFHVRLELGIPGCPHFKIDEPERAVVVDDDFDGKIVLHKREQFAHEHGHAAVAAERDDLPFGIEQLRADGHGQGAGHGAVVERADDVPAHLGGDVAGGPDVVEAGIHGEDGFIGGVGVNDRRKMLGMRPAF